MRDSVSKHWLWTGVYLLSTAGCVSVSHMDAGLKALIGENVSTAIAVLGKPSKTEGIGKDTLYAWTASHTVVRPETRTSESYSGPMGGSTIRTTMNVPYEYYCNVRLLVNSTGRITHTAHDGNRGGCNGYDKVLKNYSEQVRPERRQ
jgi:hypothetical protein